MANAILNESLLKPQNTIQCIQLTEISHCTCGQIKKKLDKTSNYMAEPLKVLSDEGGRVFLNIDT